MSKLLLKLLFNIFLLLLLFFYFASQINSRSIRVQFMKLRDGKVIGKESEEEELSFSLKEFFNIATSFGKIVLN